MKNIEGYKMKILKSFLVLGIILQALLLSGCDENTHNTASSESIDSNSFESYVAACEDAEAEADPEACFKAGKVYSSEAYKEPDYDQEAAAEKVAQFYLKSCELGFAEGCTEYAMMYTADSQRDTSKDSRYYFQKGCDGGDDTGCSMLKMLPEGE